MKKKSSYSKVDPQIIEVVNLSKENDYAKALTLGKRLLGKFNTNEVLLNTIFQNNDYTQLNEYEVY